MTSLELWKSLVESFATLHDGVHNAWIVDRGQYPVNEDNEDVNSLLASLTLAQRKTLAEMLIDARRGGVHDALVILNDRMALNEGVYCENGVQMEFQPYGYTLYQDYAGRRNGYEWKE